MVILPFWGNYFVYLNLICCSNYINTRMLFRQKYKGDLGSNEEGDEKGMKG